MTQPDLPDPVDLVDTDWNVEERQVVVDYLEAGMETPWIMVGSTDCQFCEVSLTNRQLTDQVYVWPTGLAHYLRDHGVGLPPEFVANVRAYYDQPPNMDSTWWEATRSP